MIRSSVGLTIAGVVAITACSGDAGSVFTAQPGHNAYVRFVNAIPDSGGQDWRFVDAVEGSPTTLSLTFRGIFPGTSYQSATAGTRHLRIFQSVTDLTYADPTKTTPGIVSTVFVDSTFTLEEGKHYTIMAVGNLRAPRTAKLVILTDNYSDPTTNVALRVVNTGVGASALDVYASAAGGTSALPSSPLAAALNSYAASQWVNMTPGALAVRANVAGSTTLPALIDATAPPGVPADRSLNLTAIGGSTIAGSAFTAFIFPAAVAGSPAAAVVSGTCPSCSSTVGIMDAVDPYPRSGV